MTQATFADLEIRIFPRQEDGYPVEIHLDGQQEFPRGYLHADILSWIPSGKPLTDGQNLFNFLFDDKSLHRAWHHAVGQSSHRRIRLWIDTDAPELHAVPWELLHDGQTFLAANAATPMSRYLPGVATWGRAVLQGPLRVLVVIANPTDLADYGLVSLDLEQERSVLDAAFAALPPNRRHLDFLDAPVTLARLKEKLREGYHILHFVGHGAFNQRQKQACLYLQDAQGNTEIITSNALVAMLKRLDQRPHLVFLAACQTAKRDTADAFVGFGPELVRADIPSVVAMQGDIAMSTSQTLSHTFYQQLVRHGRADLAFNEARSTLLTTQRSDAAMPMLFMRLKDGQLWQPPERHDFYQHIPLPPHYIPRLDVLSSIRATLLEGPTGLVLTSAVKMNALHGMGGIGKTVIARSLCDDPEVQAAFPDGILWATLGQTPNLTARLREWVEELGGIISENAPTPAQLKNKLAQLLENRACLLVVDDVWQRTHAETFQVGGVSCRLLLTTRDAEIPRALGAPLQPVDVLPETQAVALLEQWAEGSLNDTPFDLKQRIVARLGCLPLALKLAGAQLRDEAPEVWLQAFTIDDLEAPRIESPHDSLVTTFAHSLGQLSVQERQCYISLAIFREDEPVLITAIAKLWEAQDKLSRRKVVRLLKDLASRALLQITETPDALKVTLHDLLRDFITAELGEQGRLMAHRELLDAYHATKSGAGWHTAPNDKYLYTHLAYHLDAIGDYEALKALLADDAWLHARVVADYYTYDGYLADFSLVWARAQSTAILPTGGAQLPLMIADCIHYALIHTTINSLSSNYEPALVARAVEAGLWPPERGMNIVRRIVDARKRIQMIIALLRVGGLPKVLCNAARHLGLVAARAIIDEGDRAKALVELTPQLTEDLLTEGLAAARTIASNWNRANVLVALALQFKGTARELVLAEGLAAGRALRDKRCRAEVLVALAAQLTGEARELVLAEGLAAAHATVDEWSRAKILVALAAQLTGEAREQALAEGLVVARATADERRRAEILATLAPQLKGDLLAEGLATARVIESAGDRADALAALAPQLEGIVRKQIVAEELVMARVIADEWSRAKILAVLIPQLTGTARERALMEGLAAARAMADEWSRAEVLVALIPQLTGDAREQALAEGLAAARAIRDKRHQADTLTALAPQLTGALLAEGLAAARAIDDEEGRGEVLAALAPQLTGDLLREGLTAHAIADGWYLREALAALTPQLTGVVREHILAEELAMARAITNEWSRAWVLAELAPQLTGTLLAEGLAAARAIADEGRRAKVLAALAPQLTGALLAEGLAAARAIDDEEGRMRFLVALAPQLTGDLLEEGLAAARAIDDEESRALVLAALVPQLTGTAREQALAEGLAAARAITNEWSRARVLVALAPQFTEALLAEGLAVARAAADERRRAWVLAELAPQLTGTAREQALAEGLAAARAIDDEESRARVLTALAPHLTGTAREMALAEGLAAARVIRDKRHQADTLKALAPQLTGALLAEGLAAAHAVRGKWHRMEVLAALAPQLTDDLLAEELAAARTIEDEEYRVNVLAVLVSRLTGVAREQALAEVLATARAIADEGRRAEVLAALAPQLTGTAREQALAEGLAAARAITNEGGRAWVLAALAPQLTGDLLEEGSTAARTIEDKEYRVDVLAALTLSTNTSDSILEDIRRALLNCFWDLQNQERATLLKFLTHHNLVFLRALGISQEGYEQIAQSIIAICTQWEWL